MARKATPKKKKAKQPKKGCNCRGNCSPRISKDFANDAKAMGAITPEDRIRHAAETRTRFWAKARVHPAGPWLRRAQTM